MKRTTSPQASLGDIARAAGVSKATACYVLRNHPGPSQQTRELVQRVACELGYAPDPRITSWMARIRDAGDKELLPVAWLDTNPEKDAWEKYKFYTPYLEGARERAAQLGYSVERIWSAEPGMSMRRIAQIVHQRGIEGVVVSHSVSHMRLNWDSVCAVALENSLMAPRLDRVLTDRYFNLLLAFKMVRRFGYRRIGVCLEERVDRFSSHGCAAATHYFHATIPADECVPPLFYKGENDEYRYQTVSTVLSWLRRERPDVVIGHSNLLQLWVKDAGLRVPGDIGIVHLATDDDVADWAGIHSNRREIGAAAVERVIAQLQNRQFGIPETAVNLMIRGSWHPGRTLLIPKPG